MQRLLVLAFLLSGCGQDVENRRTRPQVIPSVPKISPTRPVVVRGEWTAKVRVNTDYTLASTRGSSTVEVQVNVPEAVRFEVDSSQIVPPPAPEDGEISFGGFDITRLRDNKLSQCGAAGDEPCSTAAIRIYSIDKPGAGMWNDALGYGIPVSTNTTVIGTGVANAQTVATTSITGTRVLKLSDFGDAIFIPISVDFSNAAAGDYAMNLRIEYVLQ